MDCGIQERMAEATEKLTTKIANGEDIPENLKHNGELKLAEKLAGRIEDEFPNLIELEQLGNNYDTLGDLVIKLEENEIYIEAKFVTSTNETLANLGRHFLIKIDLLKDAKHVSQFRDDIGYT